MTLQWVDDKGRQVARVYCDLCGAELVGFHHPAVLLINHHKWQHANEGRVAA